MLSSCHGERTAIRGSNVKHSSTLLSRQPGKCIVWRAKRKSIRHAKIRVVGKSEVEQNWEVRALITGKFISHVHELGWKMCFF